MLSASYVIQIRELLNKLMEDRGWSEQSVKRLYDMLAISAMPPAQQPHRPAMQAPIYFYIRGLKARPYHDAEQFDFTSHLEKMYPEILKEFEYVLKQGLVLDHRETSRNVARGRWGEFNIYNAGKISIHNKLIPATTEALKHLPGGSKMGLAYFSTLAPRTHIRPHWGPHNMRLRVHLGLSSPHECAMEVAREKRVWQVGKCIVFDDSFYHSAWNDSNSMRVILLADFWHPDLTEVERCALTEILKIRP